MTTVFGSQEQFVDRRSRSTGDEQYEGLNRRQFSNAHNSGRPEVDELARAVDQYKLQHRRRFITYEELYDVMSRLGYHKD